MLRGMPRTWTPPAGLALLAVLAGSLTTGCVGHRVYNALPDEYLTTLEVPDSDHPPVDLAFIEFDEQGTFWNIAQLEDTLELIRRRNAEAERGVAVVVYVHGWQNNADPERGDAVRFREYLKQLALAQTGPPRMDMLVGVYIGWRGATSRIPLHKGATFWDRKRAAERMVSYNTRETLFRLMSAVRERRSSRAIVIGHSMGGLIVGKTLGPSLATLMLAGGEEGVRLPADMAVLQNPALDGLASWQLIDFMKRANTRLMLRSEDGTLEPAEGPLILSITSEADAATGMAYTAGQALDTLFDTFRSDRVGGVPSQRYLATHAEGHIDYLVSHRAWVEDGEIRLERVPDAYNNTPFWIVRVTKDISKDHGDVRNPRFTQLVRQIAGLNRVYDTDIEQVVFADPDRPSAPTPGR